MPSVKRLVGLRLDDSTYAQLEKLAETEMRSVAQMAEILLRAGLRDTAARVKRSAAKEAKAWAAIDRNAKKRGGYG